MIPLMCLGINQGCHVVVPMPQWESEVIAAMKEGGCQTLAHPDFRMEVGAEDL